MTAEAEPKPTTIAGLKWWQAALLYPALFSGIGAGIPRAWEEWKAFRLGIHRHELQTAQEQERLWAKNLPCITERGVWEVDGPEGLVVKVSLCTTGDVLLRYHLNSWSPVYRWVARPDPKLLHP